MRCYPRFTICLQPATTKELQAAGRAGERDEKGSFEIRRLTARGMRLSPFIPSLTLLPHQYLFASLKTCSCWRRHLRDATQNSACTALLFLSLSAFLMPLSSFLSSLHNFFDIFSFPHLFFYTSFLPSFLSFFFILPSFPFLYLGPSSSSLTFLTRQ